MRFRGWWRSALDGIAVLIGILMAFGIQAWWDVRQERVTIEEHLQSLSAELSEAESGFLAHTDYLEGSRVATGTLSGETWILDVEAGAWRALSPEPSPAPRSHHTLALDPGSGRIIAFGGELKSAYSGVMSDELWAFDPGSMTWARIGSD